MRIKAIILSLCCATALGSCGNKPATYHTETKVTHAIISTTSEAVTSTTSGVPHNLTNTESWIEIKDDAAAQGEEEVLEETSKVTTRTEVVSTIVPEISDKETTTTTTAVRDVQPVIDTEVVYVEVPTETTTTQSEVEFYDEDENPYTGIDEYSYQLLAEIVWHEAGMETIGIYDKAHIAAAVMNRVYDERFPNTVYENLIDQSQFPGFYVGTCTPTQICYDAVDYYFAHPYEFDNSNSWFGNGSQNYFYYQ